MKRKELVYFNGQKVATDKLDYCIVSFDGIVQETFDFKGIYVSMLENSERLIITCNIEDALYVIDTKERTLNIKKKLPNGDSNIDQTQVLIRDNRVVFILDKDIATAINLYLATVTDTFGREVLFIRGEA